MSVQQNPLIGVICMISGIFMLSVMDAAAKWLGHNNIDPAQMIAVRSAVIVPVIVLYCVARNQTEKLITTRPLPIFLRGVFGFIAPYFFFKSLQQLPLADATVIFLSSVFMTTALSQVFLKDKVGLARWSAITLGFIGVIIAMRPQGSGQWHSYAYCLSSSVAYSILFLSGRWLSKTESVTTLVFTFNLSAGVVGFCFLPWIWQPMQTSVFYILMLLAVLALLGHILLTKAFSLAPISLISPFEYTTIIWSVILGYVLWQDLPDSNLITGAILIVGSGLYVIYRETRKAKP